MSGPTNVIRLAIATIAELLGRLGLIDAKRGRRTAELAWPRVVTGLARKSKSTADLAMVGLAIGPAAIAGLGFAFAFLIVATGIGFSLGNGSMTFLAQRFGADDLEGLDLAFKQTVWVELLLAGTFSLVFIGFAEPLITVLGAGPEALGHGTLYLQVIAFSLFFEMPTQVASRTLISANDAWSPMVIRASGAVGNILLNVIFIFGLDLGVVGAALGTVISSVVVAAIFTVGLLRGRLPWIGELPLRIRAGPPYFDLPLMRDVLVVSIPLMGKRLVSRFSNFAMLAIVAQFGTVLVAAYAVAREVRSFMNTPGWGFDTAARSLVGQELGNNAEQEAEAFGRDILRLSLIVYICASVLMFVFAIDIASFFTDDPEVAAVATPFIKVMSLSLIGLGIDSAASGTIGAAGDNNWPLYARLVGLYVFMIPIAYLGVVTPAGVVAIYIAVSAETIVPALITYHRFRSGNWKRISRRYRPSV